MTDRLSSSPLRVLGTQDDVAGLAAINTTILKNGSVVFVTALQDYFFLLKDSTAVADGISIVAPLPNSPGRWFRMFAGGGENWATQAAWFVDPIDGDDTNNGETAATAIATMAELQRRIGSAYINQDTTITLLNDIPDADFFGFRGSLGPAAFLRLVGGNPTVLGTGVLTGVTPEVPAAGTRGSITIAGFDFSPFIGERVRVTAGVNAGIVAWIEGVTGGNATAYVSAPIDPPNYTNADFTIGDTIVIEQLTKVGRLAFVCPQADNDNNNSGGTVQLTDLWMDQQSANHVFRANVQMVWFGSKIFNDAIHNYVLGYSVGSYVSTTWFFSDFFEVYSSSLNLGTLLGGTTITITTSSSCPAQVLFCNNANQIYVGAPLAIWDWPVGPGVGAAVLVAENSFLACVDRLWGSSAVAGTFGVEVRGDSEAVYAVLPTVVGALSPGQDVVVGGTPLAYAGLPFINPLNDGKFVVRA